MFQGYRAVAAGVKEQEAMNWLEKEWKKTEGNLDETATIQMAIECLQNSLGEDFKAKDIEVGIITRASPMFRKLEEGEIDGHLNAIADKD
jgi:20S proteasome subunit alpha 1